MWLVYAGLGLLAFLGLAGGGSKAPPVTPKEKADDDKKKADDLKKDAEDKAKKAEESKDAKDAEEALKAAMLAKQAAYDSGFSAGVADKSSGFEFNGGYGNDFSGDLKAAAKEGYSAGYSSVPAPSKPKPTYDALAAAYTSGYAAGQADKRAGKDFNPLYGASTGAASEDMQSKAQEGYTVGYSKG